MKTQIIIVAIILLLTSAKTANYDLKNNTAEVNQIDGLYVFTDSRPVKEYEFLGSMKPGITMSGTYYQVINKIAKKARKEYPAANGIIFNGDDKAEVIKFK